MNSQADHLSPARICEWIHEVAHKTILSATERVVTENVICNIIHQVEINVDGEGRARRRTGVAPCWYTLERAWWWGRWIRGWNKRRPATRIRGVKKRAGAFAWWKWRMGCRWKVFVLRCRRAAEGASALHLSTEMTTAALSPTRLSAVCSSRVCGGRGGNSRRK